MCVCFSDRGLPSCGLSSAVSVASCLPVVMDMIWDTGEIYKGFTPCIDVGGGGGGGCFDREATRLWGLCKGDENGGARLD